VTLVELHTTTNKPDTSNRTMQIIIMNNSKLYEVTKKFTE